MDHCRGHACNCMGSKQNRRNYNGLAWVSATVFISFFLLILCGDFISWLDMSIFSGVSIFQTSSTKEEPATNVPQIKIEYPLNCSNNITPPQKCPANYPVTFRPTRKTSTQCPDYFRWIHEYLKPWKKSGITREVMEMTRNISHFRLVIVKGKLYVEHFGRSYQTRDVYTIWGILQVLRLYPGKVPDLELMFFCNDRPIIMKSDYQGPNVTSPPPPLFRYCANDSAYDIPMPDWSFWGWPETDIKPWEKTFGAIQEGAKKTKWEDRIPYAFWKGNPGVAETRRDLMKCNATGQHEWNAELFVQEWHREITLGFKNSHLEDQCNYRYKIYIEGEAWSVSEKYILSCNSMTLFVNPDYLDFFIRGMTPLEHYWPIRVDNKCGHIKFAVEWGNNHTKEAQQIGEAASTFMRENVSIKFVHDYIFHMLTNYAKLLKFKPEIPPGAVEYCAEAMACSYSGRHREAMEDSLIKSPSDEPPCKLPPPYATKELQSLLKRKDKIHTQVEMWEHEYWENLKKQN